ncbi:cyd operon YbgE family protein [Solimonas marina]|uniref:Cyd operon protein YbgE n=1 Tax=Solimonas marina TaxID=2714601 RepID=A0A970B9N9_9GAMM|nr:cyd operon YbgE family protein [Solimonas marina]NKF22566.1 hypothetical protein [Solimonas marina]
MTTRSAPRDTALFWPALLVGLALMIGLTADPRLLTDAGGHADHLAATLAGWAMAAGIVRGVGFVPQHRVPRWLLSGWACALAGALTVLRLAIIGA